MIKTYGVYGGMMEWVCRLRVGKGYMSVPFTGGTQTGYGHTPATYTTNNGLVQHVIEASDYYGSGRIVLLGSEEEEADRISRGGGGCPGAPAGADSGATTLAHTGAGCGAAEAAPTAGDWDEAADWLVRERGYKRSAVRYHKGIAEAARKEGLRLLMDEADADDSAADCAD